MPTQFNLMFNGGLLNATDVTHRQHQHLPVGYGCKSVTFRTLWGWKEYVGAKNDDPTRSMLVTIGRDAWCGYRLIGPDGECWASDATVVPPYPLVVGPRAIKRPQVVTGDAIRKGLPGVFEVSPNGEGWTHDITVAVEHGSFEGPTGFFAVDWRMNFLLPNLKTQEDYHPESPRGRIQASVGVWATTTVIFNQ